MKILIVVDMQNDFVTGSLGSVHAEVIVPAVIKKVKSFDGRVIFTRDTHDEGYFKTQEGMRLPVEHCVKDTEGWQIIDALSPYVREVIDKPTFGSLKLVELLTAERDEIEEIELCGLCTDICVISNAMLLKAALPEVKITVHAGLCAGVTPESHENALAAMRMVQIDVVSEH